MNILSERSDLLNQLPTHKLEKSDLVYKSKHILNTDNRALRAILNNGLMTSGSVVTVNTNWDNLELNSVSKVISYDGQNAPSLMEGGLVFNIGENQNTATQIVFSGDKIAVREVGNDWNLISGGSNSNEIDSRILSDINSVLNNYNLNNLSTSIQNVINKARIANNNANSALNLATSLGKNVLQFKGNIPDPHLNNDTTPGYYIINQSVSSDPALPKVANSFNGRLKVAKLDGQNILQVLYVDIGTNGNTVILYRVNLYSAGSQDWLSWEAVPHAEDISSLSGAITKNYSQLVSDITGANNAAKSASANADSAKNKANGINLDNYATTTQLGTVEATASQEASNDASSVSAYASNNFSEMSARFAATITGNLASDTQAIWGNSSAASGVNSISANSVAISKLAKRPTGNQGPSTKDINSQIDQNLENKNYTPLGDSKSAFREYSEALNNYGNLGGISSPNTFYSLSASASAEAQMLSSSINNNNTNGINFIDDISKLCNIGYDKNGQQYERFKEDLPASIYICEGGNPDDGPYYDGYSNKLGILSWFVLIEPKSNDDTGMNHLLFYNAKGNIGISNGINHKIIL